MKNYIKTIATTVAFSALLSNAVMAENKGTDTTDFIVNGIILKSSKASDAKCKLELFNENRVVESSEIKMNKPFERKLKKNVWYTIRITKEGYKPLLISFNTALENNANVLDNIFEFETALIDNESARFMDKDQIDFPVGVVAYNKENQKFEAKDIYTSNYMATLYKPSEDYSDVAVVYTNINKPAAEVAVAVADIAKEYVTHRNLTNGMC